jgi:hypothetical protein
MPEARIYIVKEKRGKEVITPVRGARVTHNEGERIWEPGNLNRLRGIKLEHGVGEMDSATFTNHIGTSTAIGVNGEHYFEKRGRRYLITHY